MPDHDLNQPEAIELTVHPGERQSRTMGQPVLAGQCCCCCCCLHSIGAVIGAAIAPAVGSNSKARYNQEQRDYRDDFDEALPPLPPQRGRSQIEDDYEDDYEDEYRPVRPRTQGNGRRAIGLFWIWLLFGTMLTVVISIASTAQGNAGAGEAIAIVLLLVFIFYPLVMLGAAILSAITIGILPADDKPKQFGVLLKIVLGGIIGTVCGSLVMAFFPLLGMIFR